jgi:hypothetical protein
MILAHRSMLSTAHHPAVSTISGPHPPPGVNHWFGFAESFIMASSSSKTSRESGGARALAAGITQIELALREAHPSVEKLGQLIQRMAETLGELRTLESAQGGSNPRAASCADVERTIEQLQADLYAGIRELQFYDRTVQHLSRIQDYLLSVANQLASDTDCGAAAEVWDELGARLRTSLISDAQRELLDLVLTPPPGAHTARVARAEHASQGSIELF